MNLFKTLKGGRLLAFLMALALIFIFGACDWGKDEGTNIKDGVDYESYNTDYAILVRNNTSKDLVAFMGSLENKNIIGGIPAKAQGHGIKKNTALFDRSKDFPMILLTKEDYAANKSNPAALVNTPFTRVYVFYNHNGDNSVNYDISDKLGGINKLKINNTTGLNAELRLGGVGGETIGYAPNNMLETTLRVESGDYLIFPVFKRYNSLRDTVDIIYPKMANGYNYFVPLGFEESPTGIERTISLTPTLISFESQTTGAAWLVIQNGLYPPSDIRLVKGSEVVRTSTGVSLFGQTKTFQLNMDVIGHGSNNTTFADSLLISSYSIGVTGFEKQIVDENGNTNIVCKRDTQYTVVVEGDYTSVAGITVTIIMEEGKPNSPKPIDVEDFFN